MTDTRVAVIGAGTMGHGIAYVAALAGFEVTLSDTRSAALAEATARIGKLLDGAVARGKLSTADRSGARARVGVEPLAAEAVRGAAIVIEAVAENLELKQRLFGELDRAAPADALLATNTSSLSVEAIARAVPAPGRVIGLHFFNPVYAMPLVEVVTHERTEQETVERALGFVRGLGKQPIVVKDSPGFASSRLGVVLGLEAMRMLEAGVASAEDIDRAMELGYNHPMGPLKLSDLVGLDVRLAIADALYEALRLPHYQAPRILRDKVARGELGKKTGKGFYTWNA